MKRMSAPRTLTLAALTLTVASFAAPLIPALAQADQSDLSKVNAYIRAVTTMTADFAQTDRNGNIYAASDDQHNVVKWVKN